jgi:glutathione S-transferase
MSAIELYDRENCPYSQKVRDKLHELEIEYDETQVPDAHSDRTEVQERTGQTSVPVIIDDGLSDGYLADSQEIVDYLEREYA